MSFSLRRSLALLTLTLLASACTPAGGPSSRDAADEGPATTTYASQNRPDVRGTRGAVSADHPLAAQAGLAVLQEGGTATDAIIAMAGVLAVVRPHMNGVGGDAFAIFYEGDTGEVTTLNGSGRAGALATPDFFLSRGIEGVPEKGAGSVSVPGAVAAWYDAHERYGTLPMARLLRPAVAYARDGFPVSWRLASDIEAQGGDLNDAGRALYAPGGSAPPVGSLLANVQLAQTLAGLAANGKEWFYRDVGARLATFVEAEGGYLRPEDFTAHTSTWVDPLSVDYLDHTFLVMPPNTQGVAQLAYMEMAKHHPIESLGHNTAEYLHTMIELKKLAFADRDRWVADPEKADVPVARMLDPDYLRERAAQVDMSRAADEVAPGFGGDPTADPGTTDDSGDTVYLTAVDEYGNAVSWIQSLYAGFGSGLLDPSTGVVLQNRGALFTLQAGHPNRIAPHKRPYHTLTPMMTLRDGGLAFTIGTPGGDSQTQTLIQIVHNMLVFGMGPQQAIEAPRYRSNNGLSLQLENRMDDGALAVLRSLGHRVRLVDEWTATFGGAQMIYVDPVTGSLAAAADPRREAYALAY